MKEKLTLMDKLCIYGNHYFILSDKCYGCYHFNYLCGGPECGGCPAGDFRFDKYQAYAEYITCEKLDGNSYLLGRLLGLDLVEHLNKLNESLSRQTEERQILAYKEMIADVQEALDVPNSEIEKLKKELHIESDLKELDLVIKEFVKEFHPSQYEIWDELELEE